MALDFVMNRLVFISETEMRHLISLVPTTIIDPILRARIADAHGLASYRIAEIERHDDFVALRRKSLVLGASDGARLDRLRRVSRLSHEQFLQTPARPSTSSESSSTVQKAAIPEDRAPLRARVPI